MLINFSLSSHNMDGPPDKKAVSTAGDLLLTDEIGQKVRFADLIRENKTIVVFIRNHHSCSVSTDR
jgi:cytochrome oxidase Cu insertion factor (SCO1/SenC/PrrC family)